MLEPGYFSNYGFDREACKPGHYCVDGESNPCPQGFICPRSHMPLPQRCPPDPTMASTCAQGVDRTPALSAPLPCPAGSLCLAPYYPALPAPPGYMTVQATSSRLELRECPPGLWCGIGRASTMNATELECPNGFYCSNSAVLQPSFCDAGGRCIRQNGTYAPGEGPKTCQNHAPYCPANSTTEQNCTAGYFCDGPTSKLRKRCNAGAYCPNGTNVWSLCPAGSYCPTPAQKIVCPAGNFCPSGSTVPRPCGAVLICPKGSTKPNALSAETALC